MINPSLEEMLEPTVNPKIGSKFELITMISKRAKQINNGGRILTETESRKPVTIAMKEIEDGNILPVKKEVKRL